MDASMHDSSSMSGMTFINAHNTPLYSNLWTPSSSGAYAGTCIFLILLAIAFRSLWAAKVLLEIRWLAEARHRRYVLVKGQSTEAARIDNDPDAKVGSLITVNGVEESIKVVKAGPRSISPFRLSIDLPRAALFTVITGVGYLLMLAVMTMNVGYFLSVLAGSFVGELMVGRYAQAEEH